MKKTRNPLAKYGAIIAFTLPLSGCLVAGYSSGSGLWVWPGSIVLTVILVLLYLLTRRH